MGKCYSQQAFDSHFSFTCIALGQWSSFMWTGKIIIWLEAQQFPSRRNKDKRKSERKPGRDVWQSLRFSLDLDSVGRSKHAVPTYLHPSRCPAYFRGDCKQLPALQLIHIFHTHSKYNIQSIARVSYYHPGMSRFHPLYLLVLETERVFLAITKTEN